MGEEKNNNVHCWEARTGELHRPLKSSKFLGYSLELEWLESELQCREGISSNSDVSIVSNKAVTYPNRAVNVLICIMKLCSCPNFYIV